MLRIAANTCLNRFEVVVAIVVGVDDRRAQGGVLHLGELLFLGAGGQHAPLGKRVVEVPVLKREGEATANCPRLTEDLTALRSIALDEAHAAAVNLRIVAGGNDRLPQDGALR